MDSAFLPKFLLVTAGIGILFITWYRNKYYTLEQWKEVAKSLKIWLLFNVLAGFIPMIINLLTNYFSYRQFQVGPVLGNGELILIAISLASSGIGTAISRESNEINAVHILFLVVSSVIGAYVIPTLRNSSDMLNVSVLFFAAILAFSIYLTINAEGDHAIKIHRLEKTVEQLKSSANVEFERSVYWFVLRERSRLSFAARNSQWIASYQRELIDEIGELRKELNAEGDRQFSGGRGQVEGAMSSYHKLLLHIAQERKLSVDDLSKCRELLNMIKNLEERRFRKSQLGR